MAKRLYTKEFWEGAVERLKGCENIAALAKELGDRGDSSTGGAMIVAAAGAGLARQLRPSL